MGHDLDICRTGLERRRPGFARPHAVIGEHPDPDVAARDDGRLPRLEQIQPRSGGLDPPALQPGQRILDPIGSLIEDMVASHRGQRDPGPLYRIEMFGPGGRRRHFDGAYLPAVGVRPLHLPDGQVGLV